MSAFEIIGNANPTFLLAFFAREQFYSRFKLIAAGGRKAVRIQPEELLKRKIFLPSRPEQDKIAVMHDALIKELDLLWDQLSQLQEQKKGLMQVLLTGKVRVKGKYK